MKIFISQPMGGKTFLQIKLEREKLTKELQMQGHEIIETVFEEYDENKGAVYYLGKSIELMEKCDRVVFMPRLGKSKRL